MMFYLIEGKTWPSTLNNICHAFYNFFNSSIRNVNNINKSNTKKIVIAVR